jgi:hypothetical protein
VDVAIAAAALAGGAHAGRCQVRDVLGQWVLRAHAAGVDGARLAGLGERVVARVEVLALLEVLGQVVRFGGELAVQSEEALLVGGEGLRVGAGSARVSFILGEGGLGTEDGEWRHRGMGIVGEEDSR